MSFNSDFWVTIGTAAPVVALSCILIVSDQVSIISSRRARKLRLTKSSGTVFGVVVISYVINCVNLLIQAWVFYNALDGLATRTNFAPERVTAFVETFSVFLLFASTALIVAAKIPLKKDEDRQLALESSQANSRDQIQKEIKPDNIKRAVSQRQGLPRSANRAYRSKTGRKVGRAKSGKARATSMPGRTEGSGRSQDQRPSL